MKSKIKQITLIDGKQLFYPSEEEVRKLGDVIKEVVIEETLTKAEYDNEGFTIPQFDRSYLTKNGDG